MTNNTIATAAFFAGHGTLLLIGLHVAWAKIRVIRLQNEIRTRQNELAIFAMETNTTASPAYITLSEKFDSFYRLAPDLSLYYIDVHNKFYGLQEEEPKAIQWTDNRKMDEFVLKQSLWISPRMQRYIFKETLTGRAFMTMLSILGLSNQLAKFQLQMPLPLFNPQAQNPNPKPNPARM